MLGRATNGMWMRVVHLSVLAASCAASLAAWTIILRGVLPVHPVTEADRRRLVFERASPSYDTVFFGTSRTHRGLDPATFDARTAAAGRPTHSFNFGVAGLRLFEARSVLEDLLAADRDGRLRYVFLEMPSARWAMRRVNLRSERVIRYHDWATFVSILRHRIEDPEQSIWKGLQSLIPFGANRANAGLGSAAFQRFAVGAGPVEDFIAEGAAGLGDRRDGFQSLDRALAMSEGVEREDLESRHRLLLPPPEKWEANRERLRERLSTPKRATDVAVAILGDLATMIEERGAIPVFYTTTSRSPHWDLIDAHERGAIPLLLSFDDPDRYPELYQRNLHFDAGHLNEEGAQLYSVTLADAFLDLDLDLPREN